MNKKLYLALVIGSMVANSVWAGTYEWTKGWAQGVTEHMVSDGNGNELNVSCSNDEETPITAYATIAGAQYASDDNRGGFDVIVDGKIYSNPFYTDCNVCSNIFRNSFWEDLRKANNLQVSAGGKTINLPTKNIKKTLLPLNHKENSCHSAW